MLLYLFYQWALPKPIPGIPYNEDAVKSLFGDIGPMVAHTKTTSQLYDWVTAQTTKLNSPIIQLFTRPLAKPWVVIADYRETQDILLRRAREFDRSHFFREISGGLTPENHFILPTDAEFKRHRQWVQGLMTPSFLNGTAAPHTHAVGLDLLALWEEKMRLGGGRPFAVSRDVHETALDTIWNITFGVDPKNSVLKAHTRLYRGMIPRDAVNGDDIDIGSPLELPTSPYSEAVQSVLTLTQSVQTTVKSPMPKLAHWVLRQTPAMRKAYKVKENFTNSEIQKSIQRSKEKLYAQDDSDVTCAIDDVLRRETLLAAKEDRAPMLHCRGIYDEIFGLLIGAHDTTGTALSWGLKFLADNPGVQEKFRSELRAAHMDAVTERRLPSAQEITGTAIHYRDAVVEEIIRCSLTESAVIRTTLTDVQVLGHWIPKGTEVFFMGNGPSIFTPAFAIDDSLRTPSCLAAKETIRSWDPKDMAQFMPERWLVRDDEQDGKMVFDPSAGPMLTFGLGERGCYGRKLSYVEMRLLLTLIVWHFELQKCPEELSGYGAVDSMTHGPTSCYVKLARVDY
ncbi:cytochrome P450 monooxygenase [Aspergillus stella-maris]|uniref:cytochrome P450 monooxygenase n=1 Tax=Aspergillus stella-maris TaxID=1810926 RepID=UPI003CCE331F